MSTNPPNATQEECAPIYQRYFGAPMEPAYYIKWVREYPHTRSVVQFENTIINSVAFHRHVEKQLEGVYREWIDPVLPKDLGQKMFHSLYVEHKLKQGPSQHQLVSFVKSLPEFVEKYTQIIRRLYRLVNNEDAPDQVVRMYMDKLKDPASDYTLQQLNEDLITGKGPSTKPSDNIMKFITQTWVDVYNAPPSSHEINELFDIASDTHKTLQTLIMYKCSSQNSRLVRKMQEFLAVFRRECTVYELIKWEHKFKTLLDGNTAEWLGELHKQHQHHFDTVRALYQKYHDVQIDELQFIKEYLNVVDRTEWETVVVDILVSSPIYEEKMRGHIQTLYESLYGKRADKDDEDYMFLEMKSLHVDLKSQAVMDTITRLKEETDDTLERLDRVFNNVLVRGPDEVEVRQYKKLYREQKTCDKADTDAEIESELYNSLEYHDILKQSIRDAFAKKHGKQPLPSQLYGILNKLLQDGQMMRDVSRIAEVV